MGQPAQLAPSERAFGKDLNQSVLNSNLSIVKGAAREGSGPSRLGATPQLQADATNPRGPPAAALRAHKSNHLYAAVSHLLRELPCLEERAASRRAACGTS